MSQAAGAENPWAGQGSVLLDIGGDIGALLVRMPATMEGVEVEIRPVGEHQHDHHQGQGQDHAHDHEGGHLPHVAVVNRAVGGGTSVPSLVFPEVVEGSYELFEKGTGDVQLVTEVRGGEVTTVEWPT